ncbi:hypothetical protein D3C71_153120 [compost metagenome]
MRFIGPYSRELSLENERMQKVAYAFMNPGNGKFLRVYSTENEEDCITPQRELTLDWDDPIYETEEAAAVLDIMHGRKTGRYISREAASDWLPRVNLSIGNYVPVAFIRELQPVLPGGDLLITSMAVRLVRFEHAMDPDTLWLDDVDNLHVSPSGTPAA